ncbi:type II toxin-antitoxin system VapC family toxin [Kocuria sp.]|uniref:type II toxin-antitoxin system VapC family toxin n=1 Tax=Kocuria sp. TaxID=1871328 RepID=UPI0026DEFDA9|nr:type II toxin-antitoxin system VapC family toxin [Kocuria sp.]MDO5619646.1 type II toxin-antitoxin system VapC family toxin [Kocuria sp.]
MTDVYLDTSAAMKLVVEEPESDALAKWIHHSSPRLVSSRLLCTELHCAAWRQRIDGELVRAVLDRVSLLSIHDGILMRAGQGRSELRSADAIHLYSAMDAGLREMLVYDGELAHGARGMGFVISQPK